MSYRRKVSRGKSKRLFRKTAVSVHPKNNSVAYRGGIRM